SNQNVPSEIATGVCGIAIEILSPVIVKVSYGVANSAPRPLFVYEPTSIETACAGPAAAAEATMATLAACRRIDRMLDISFSVAGRSTLARDPVPDGEIVPTRHQEST